MKNGNILLNCGLKLHGIGVLIWVIFSIKN